MQTITRRRARKRPAEVRREELIDAAVRVFAHSPYHAAGTADIAREAGVAEPTIYRHFGSKRELYLAALARCKSMVVDAFRDIAARTPNAADALEAMGDWYKQSITLDPDQLRMRQRAVAESDDDEVRNLLHQGFGEIRSAITDVIQRGQEEGVLTRAISAETGSWIFMAIGQALDCDRLMGVEPPVGSTRFEEIATAMRAMLAAQPR